MNPDVVTFVVAQTIFDVVGALAFKMSAKRVFGCFLVIRVQPISEFIVAWNEISFDYAQHLHELFGPVKTIIDEIQVPYPDTHPFEGKDVSFLRRRQGSGLLLELLVGLCAAALQRLPLGNIARYLGETDQRTSIVIDGFD